jgi:hypothetical protein
MPAARITRTRRNGRKAAHRGMRVTGARLSALGCGRTRDDSPRIPTLKPRTSRRAVLRRLAGREIDSAPPAVKLPDMNLPPSWGPAGASRVRGCPLVAIGAATAGRRRDVGELARVRPRHQRPTRRNPRGPRQIVAERRANPNSGPFPIAPSASSTGHPKRTVGRQRGAPSIDEGGTRGEMLPLVGSQGRSGRNPVASADPRPISWLRTPGLRLTTGEHRLGAVFPLRAALVENARRNVVYSDQWSMSLRVNAFTAVQGRRLCRPCRSQRGGQQQ